MLLKAFSSQWKLPLKTIPLDWGDTSNSVYSNLPLHSTVTIFSLISTLRFDKVKFPIFMHVKPPDDVGLATLIPTVWWKFPKQVNCQTISHKILPWSSPAVWPPCQCYDLISWRIAVLMYRQNWGYILSRTTLKGNYQFVNFASLRKAWWILRAAIPQFHWLFILFIDICSQNPPACRHGGSCTPQGEDDWTCECADKFSGEYCEIIDGRKFSMFFT